MGTVSQVLAKHRVSISRGRVDIHRDQSMEKGLLQSSSWPSVRAKDAALFRSVVDCVGGTTAWRFSYFEWRSDSLTGKTPSDAIKALQIAKKKASAPVARPVGVRVQKLPCDVGVRFLYQPGELEGGRRRARVPVWSLEVCPLRLLVT